jgi:hypothetical protein
LAPLLSVRGAVALRSSFAALFAGLGCLLCRGGLSFGPLGRFLAPGRTLLSGGTHLEVAFSGAMCAKCAATAAVSVASVDSTFFTWFLVRTVQ